MLKWEIACRFSNCVVRSFLYLDTDFVDILLRVPQCYLYKHLVSTTSMYLKKRWFFWAIRTSFWPGLMPAKSHSFFLWLAMFNLTTIFDLSTPSSMTDAFLFAGYYSGAFLYILKSVNMPPGHKWDRRKSENSISVWKTLLLSLTLTIVFSIINRISLNC